LGCFFLFGLKANCKFAEWRGEAFAAAAFFSTD
jgi:hypothetical protein